MNHLIQFIRDEIWHRHLFDYVLILVSAVIFLFGMRMFSGQREAQFFCIVAIFVTCGRAAHYSSAAATAVAGASGQCAGADRIVGHQ